VSSLRSLFIGGLCPPSLPFALLWVGHFPLLELAVLGKFFILFCSLCSRNKIKEAAIPRRFFGFFRRQFFLKGKIEKRRGEYPHLFNFEPFGIIK